MKILKFIDRFSFSQLASVGVVLGLLITLPVAVLLTQQETKLLSQAAREAPVTPTPIVYGPLPEGLPVIETILPFLGKVGDSLLVRGKNFGNNPREKAAFFNQQVLTPAEIVRWEDGELELTIPQGAVSGFLRIQVGGREAAWERPITVYNATTKTQVRKEGQRLSVVNAAGLKTVKVWFQGQGGLAEINFETPLTVGPTPRVLVEQLPGARIESLAFYDARGNLLPFFVNPAEFGF